MYDQKKAKYGTEETNQRKDTVRGRRGGERDGIADTGGGGWKSMYVCVMRRMRKERGTERPQYTQCRCTPYTYAKVGADHLYLYLRYGFWSIPFSTVHLRVFELLCTFT